MKTKHDAPWKRTNAFRLFLVLLSAIVLLSGSGCGDSVFDGVSSDDTYEAQLEEAKIALDDSDYSRAAEILEALEAQYPGDQEVTRYLSNAYAGLAGLDTYDLLTIIDELDDAGRSGSVDMVGTVLGDADGRMSEAQVTEKLDFLDDAIAYMEQTLAASAQSAVHVLELSEDDRVVQRGILALSRIVLLMADMILDQLPITEVIMTEAGIRVHYADQDPDFEGIYTDAMAQMLAEDIQAIVNAISVIAELSGTDNDLHEDFEAFMNDLDQNSDQRIDQTEIESYLLDIING